MERERFNRAMALLRAVARSYAGAYVAVDRDTLPEIAECIAAGIEPATIPVWSGGSEDTVWGSPDDNYAFRAWHDRAHIRTRGGFDAHGEEQALLRQQVNLAAYCTAAGDIDTFPDARRILTAEITGQLEYYQRHGAFPRRQTAFIRAYLRNPAAALRSTECM